jgi:hypothetical protein
MTYDILMTTDLGAGCTSGHTEHWPMAKLVDIDVDIRHTKAKELLAKLCLELVVISSTYI